MKYPAARALGAALALALAACGGAQMQTQATTSASPRSPPAQTTVTSTSTTTWHHTAWWESGLNTAVILDSSGHAVCNGAMVGKRYAVSLASCRGTALIHFRFDHNATPDPVRRTQDGAIAIYELDSDSDQVNPHALPPATSEDVTAAAFPYPDVTQILVPPQACHVQVTSGGAMRTDCVSPTSLPGTPLFNWNGDLVGLMSGNGNVISSAQMRPILVAHGVRRSPTDEL